MVTMAVAPTRRALGSVGATSNRNSYGKPLCQPHPVQLPLDVRQPGKLRRLLGNNAPSNSNNFPAILVVRIGHQVNVRHHAWFDMPQGALAKISDDIPVANIDQRDHLAGSVGVGSVGNIEIRNEAIERRHDMTSLQIVLCRTQRRQGALLRSGGLVDLLLGRRMGDRQRKEAV